MYAATSKQTLKREQILEKQTAEIKVQQLTAMDDQHRTSKSLLKGASCAVFETPDLGIFFFLSQQSLYLNMILKH